VGRYTDVDQQLLGAETSVMPPIGSIGARPPDVIAGDSPSVGGGLSDGLRNLRETR
jgi:hypothetical protein